MHKRARTRKTLTEYKENIFQLQQHVTRDVSRRRSTEIPCTLRPDKLKKKHILRCLGCPCRGWSCGSIMLTIIQSVFPAFQFSSVLLSARVKHEIFTYTIFSIHWKSVGKFRETQTESKILLSSE